MRFRTLHKYSVKFRISYSSSGGSTCSPPEIEKTILYKNANLEDLLTDLTKFYKHEYPTLTQLLVKSASFLGEEKFLVED